MLRILGIDTMQFGKIGDMLYTIEFKNGEKEKFSGVYRHTAGNGLMYLWGSPINGRTGPLIKSFPLDDVKSYSIKNEPESSDSSL